MQTQRNVQLRPRQSECASHFSRLGIEHQQFVADGCKYSSRDGESRRIFYRAGNERNLKNFDFSFRVKSKEFGFLLDGPGATSAIIAAAAKEESGAGFPRQ